jgi:hypothetical protein
MELAVEDVLGVLAGLAVTSSLASLLLAWRAGSKRGPEERVTVMVHRPDGTESRAEFVGQDAVAVEDALQTAVRRAPSQA